MDPELIKSGGVLLGIGVAMYVLKTVVDVLRPLFDRMVESKTHGKDSKTTPAKGTPVTMPSIDLAMMCQTLNKVHEMVSDLHEWHSVTDQDGGRIWYVRPSLVQAINMIADSQRQIAEVMRVMGERQRDTESNLHEIGRKIDTLLIKGN